MLESSTFNKLLSGVRECNKLLKEASVQKRADKVQFQALTQWIEQHDIVHRILRTNLHQKQYVQEVRSCVLVQTFGVVALQQEILWLGYCPLDPAEVAPLENAAVASVVAYTLIN